MQFLYKLLGLTKSEPGAGPSAVRDDGGPLPRLKVGWATDVGIVRSHNEDAALVIIASHDGDGAMPSFGLPARLPAL
jgi:hypothetical protein